MDKKAALPEESSPVNFWQIKNKSLSHKTSVEKVVMIILMVQIWKDVMSGKSRFVNEICIIATLWHKRLMYCIVLLLL